MKYLYQYRTSDNVQHKGVIKAADREAAFAALKARGIRPGRLDEAPGLFNKVFGKGKRWMAIGVLGAGCLVLGVILISSPGTKYQAPGTILSRARIYGDPVILQTCASAGWANVFGQDVGARFLALHAQPGLPVEISKSESWKKGVADALRRHTHPFKVQSNEPEEVQKMKRMVNGMRAELAAYVKAGGTEELYVERVMERQRVEVEIVDKVRRELDGIRRQIEKAEKGEAHQYARKWEEKNSLLRDMGMETVPMPEECERKLTEGR